MAEADRTTDTGAGFVAFERRWNRAWGLLPSVLIGCSLLLTVLTAGLTTSELLVVSLVAAALLGWHTWFVTLHPRWPEHRLLPMAVYFAGLVALSLVLNAHAGTFSVLMMGCFPMAFVALPGAWAYVGVGVVSLCLLVTVGGTDPGPGPTVQFVGAGILAASVGWAIRRIESEAVQRREAHAEVVQLNTELRRATRENEELQQHLVEAARETGVADERARLARDFHDTLAQGLAAIGTQLETADEQIDPIHPARPRIRDALALSRSSLAEARRSVHALRPGPLEVDDLLGALRNTVAEWRRHTGAACGLTVTGNPVLVDAARQTAVLRIVQEGLANIARHAAATEATVTVSYLDDRMMVDVFDDGVGFDPSARPPSDANGGYGLPAARERLAHVGGWLDVESAPGGGTTLTATVPVPAPANEPTRRTEPNRRTQ